MKNKDNRKNYLAWFIIGIILIIFFKTVDDFSIITKALKSFFNVIMPFFIGVIIAYLLFIPSRKIEKLISKIKVKFISKKARGISVFFVYVVMILILVMFFNLVIPKIYESIIDLSKSLPTYYAEAKDFLSKLPEDHLLARINLIGIIDNFEQSDIMPKVVDFLELDNISKYIKGIVDAVNIIFGVFVSFIVSVYILLERDDIKSFLRNFANATWSRETNKKIVRYYRKSNVIFYQYITGQIIDAIVIGIVTSIAMSIMQVKYGVLLGFMIGLFNVIPYFGAILAVAIAILITIFTGGIQQACWLALVIIILQQIDANIINPKILGNSLKISPILVIFAVTFFGTYFGVLGMFFAVPIIALIKVALLEYIEDRKQMEKPKE